MTEDRKVLVGVDLCDDMTQISCYRRDLDKTAGGQRERV